MKSNFILKSTTSLRVDRPDRNTYLVWTQNYLGLLTPKLKYKKSENNVLKLTKVTGQIKSIAINSLVLCVIIILTELIIENEQLNIRELLPFLIGIIIFMTTLNFLVAFGTKLKVNRQLKK